MSVAKTEADYRRARLVAFLRNLPHQIHARLAHAKTDGQIHSFRPDWLWYSLITSFSTMGNSRGYAALMANPKILHSLSYDVLGQLSSTDRRSAIESGLRTAKVRMPSRKADWLTRNFAIIENMGGVSRAKKIAFSQPNRETKIAFLRQFYGIGEKYSRNIWMDIYDRDFHETIAIDQRIKKVSAALGISFRRYEDHERYFQCLAKEAGLQPWAVDRILYGFLPDVLDAMCTRPPLADGGIPRFDELLGNAREQACKAGMTRANIAKAIRTVRAKSQR